MNIFHRIKNKFILDEDQLKYTINPQELKNSQYPFGDVKFYIATLEDINEMRQQYRNEFSEYKYNLYKKRINEDNKIIVVSKINKEICGYFNIALTDTYESGIDKIVKVNENEAYFFDDYVFKRFRGKSIQKMSVLYRLNIINGFGRNVAYVNIYSNNKASRISYEKLGFKVVKKYKRNKITKKSSEKEIE